MSKVQWMPWWWACGGLVALAATGIVVPLGIVGGATGVAYLGVSTALVSRGLAGAARFGPANAVTATRSTLVGLVTAMVAASFWEPASTPLFVAVATVALVLDAVDGWVARRTDTATAFGARFDMEVDAFLLLVLSVYDVRFVGAWVLAIGLMRYAFVVAGWMLPWLRASLPPRYWRKVVTAACGIALILVAAQLLPPVLGLAAALLALALLVESFGRDVVWLVRGELQRRGARVLTKGQEGGAT